MKQDCTLQAPPKVKVVLVCMQSGAAHCCWLSLFIRLFVKLINIRSGTLSGGELPLMLMNDFLGFLEVRKKSFLGQQMHLCQTFQY